MLHKININILIFLNILLFSFNSIFEYFYIVKGQLYLGELYRGKIKLIVLPFFFLPKTCNLLVSVPAFCTYLQTSNLRKAQPLPIQHIGLVSQSRRSRFKWYWFTNYYYKKIKYSNNQKTNNTIGKSYVFNASIGISNIKYIKII